MSKPDDTIEIVPSPRPEDDSAAANPLPSYHALLGQLCDRFGVPGSQTFAEAMDWIDAHYRRKTGRWTLPTPPNVFFEQAVMDRCIIPDGQNPCECWDPATVKGEIMNLTKCLGCGTVLASKPDLP